MKRENKKDTFSSTACMPYIVCMQPAGGSWNAPNCQIIFTMESRSLDGKFTAYMYKYFFKGVYLFCVLGCSYYTTIHTNSTSAIIQKWLGKSKTLALEGCVPVLVIFTHRAMGEYNSSSKPMYLVWEWETFFSYDYTVYYPCCWPKS